MLETERCWLAWCKSVKLWHQATTTIMSHGDITTLVAQTEDNARSSIFYKWGSWEWGPRRNISLPAVTVNVAKYLPLLLCAFPILCNSRLFFFFKFDFVSLHSNLYKKNYSMQIYMNISYNTKRQS